MFYFIFNPLSPQLSIFDYLQVTRTEKMATLVHTLTPCFLKIHPHINFLNMDRNSLEVLQVNVCISLLLMRSPFPVYLFEVYLIIVIIFREKRKYLFLSLFTAPLRVICPVFLFVPCRPQTFSSSPCSETSSLRGET